MIGSFRNLKLLVVGLSFIGALGLGIIVPATVTAETLDSKGIQEAAAKFCNSGTTEEKAACRNGFRSGYSGSKSPDDACKNRNDYSSAEKNKCRSGYNAGNDAKFGDLGGQAARAAPKKNTEQLNAAALSNCGTGDPNSSANGACRNGYRSGYSGGETMEKACTDTFYSGERKKRCEKGYKDGARARVKESPLAATTVDKCDSSFFGFPKWNKYLETAEEAGNKCAPKLNGLNDIWLILLAIIELLLRIAIIAAIAFVMIGGIKYITSQGSPDKTAQAKNTVVDGMIGVVIAIIATAVVSFIAGRFQG